MDDAVRRVASIDVGRRNLALCVYDAVARVVVHWHVYDTGLHTAPYNVERWCAVIGKLVRSWPPADVYLVEGQVPMPENHKNLLVEALVHAMVTAALGVAVHTVSPSDVSDFFLLPKGSKPAKKRAAAAVCGQMLLDRRAHIRIGDEQFAKMYVTPRGIAKRDDLADCLLQCVYWCEHNRTGSHSLASPRYHPIAPAQYRAEISSVGRGGGAAAAAAAAAAASTSATRGGSRAIRHRHARRRRATESVLSSDNGDQADRAHDDEEDDDDDDTPTLAAVQKRSQRHGRRRSVDKQKRARHTAPAVGAVLVVSDVDGDGDSHDDDDDDDSSLLNKSAFSLY